MMPDMTKRAGISPVRHINQKAIPSKAAVDNTLTPLMVQTNKTINQQRALSISNGPVNSVDFFADKKDKKSPNLSTITSLENKRSGPITAESFLNMLSHTGDTGGVSCFQNRRFPTLKDKFQNISKLLTKKESNAAGMSRTHSLMAPFEASPFEAPKLLNRQSSKLSGVPDFSIVSPNNIMTGPRLTKLANIPSMTRSLFNNSSSKNSLELPPKKSNDL